MAEPAGGAAGRRVALAALLLSASIALSRVLGFVREAVLAYRVGRGPAADAYNAAFQLPDLLNYFLAGGALSIAFIPLYTRAREQRGEAAAEGLLATVLGTMGLASLLATAGLWWLAGPLVALQFPGFDPQQQALTVRLTRIVLPAQIFFIVGGIVRGALMARGRFGAQAAAPLLYNGGIIAGGLVLAPALGVEGFAWGALAGAAVGALGSALLEARGRVRIRARVAPWDAEFLRYLALAAPLMAGVTLLTVDEWYDRYFGGVLATGTIATLVYARRLMQVPVALVGQATATAALPTLTRLWEAGRHDELERTVLRTLQVGLGLGVVFGAALATLAWPVVRLVYVRGAFAEADAAAVVEALRIFAIAVPAWIGQQIAVRPFYARGDMWRPMGLGTGLALLAIPLYLALGRRLGAPGLAAAGALAISANAAATLVLARRRHGSPPLRPLAATVARATLAALPAVAVAGWVQRGDEGTAAALLDLVLGGSAFAAVGAAALWMVGDAALREAPRRLLRRLAPR